MSKLHLHLNVEQNLFDKSVEFYTTLFGQAPSKLKADYAKWQIDDPSVNFVLGTACEQDNKVGVHHLGIQVDTSEELANIASTLDDAEAPLLRVGETTCCYSESEKNWTMDPSGIRWETFRSFGDTEEYGERVESEREAIANQKCC